MPGVGLDQLAEIVQPIVGDAEGSRRVVAVATAGGLGCLFQQDYTPAPLGSGDGGAESGVTSAYDYDVCSIFKGHVALLQG
jgi:hypothetical protein